MKRTPKVNEAMGFLMAQANQQTIKFKINSKLKILGFKITSILNLFKDIKLSKYEIIYVLGLVL